MKRLSLAFLLALLSALPRAAGAEDEDSPAAGIFGSLLKSSGLGSKLRVTGDDVVKTMKVGKELAKGFEDMTESQEHFLGRSVAAQILSRYQANRDEALNRYVQGVLQTVAAASERPSTYKGYHAQVLDSDEVNAMSAPGGFIFITTGLLKRVKDEDELAGVLGHEIGHVAKKHAVKTIQKSHFAQAGMIIGKDALTKYSKADLDKFTDAFSHSVDDVVKTVLMTGFGKKEEYAADQAGADYAKNAGYDPRALARFIAEIGEGGKSGGLLKTHPPARKRVEALDGVEPSSDYRASAGRGRRFEASVGAL